MRTRRAGFAGLRVVAETVSASWLQTRLVLLLLLWWCLIFILAGLQAFVGRLGHRCALCADAACTLVRAPRVRGCPAPPRG
jgi:hypothetical protein